MHQRSLCLHLYELLGLSISNKLILMPIGAWVVIHLNGMNTIYAELYEIPVLKMFNLLQTRNISRIFVFQ